MSQETIDVTVDDSTNIATITLNRPDVRNAFDERMIGELHEAADRLGAEAGLEGGEEAVRGVILQGAGKVFSAGADTNWMQKSIDFDEPKNRDDAMAMARMYSALDECPVPIIGRVHRAAFGGGCGLCAVCDIVVASEDTVFGFSEVKLGLIPAVISSFAIRKIGLSAARRYFLTGETFDAHEARRIQLIHEVVPENELDDKVEEIASAICAAGPDAVRKAKAHTLRVHTLSYEEALRQSAAEIARIRVGAEAQEGLKAFLNKRTPDWAIDESDS